VLEAFLLRVGLTFGVGLARRLPFILAALLCVALAVPVLLVVLLAAPDDHGAAPVTSTLCTALGDQAADPDAGGTKTTADLGVGWQENTATILSVVHARLPGPDGAQAAVVALATGMQESRLENLTGGDRDSQGVFQQRPSQGWVNVTDVAYATGAFLDQLVKVPDWATLPVTVAAQRVQRSAYPSAYAPWEPLARSLAGAGSALCTPAAVTVTGPCPVIDVSGYGNGLIPPAALCPLASAPGQQLRGDAANAFAALNDAYRAQFGLSVTVTDSYRSLASQYDVYARKPGLAAKPGTSKHGLGQALDLGGGVQVASSVQHAWMSANAARFGWVNPAWAQQRSGQFEPWHWEYGTGR
jgi:hypothetical protein